MSEDFLQIKLLRFGHSHKASECTVFTYYVKLNHHKYFNLHWIGSENDMPTIQLTVMAQYFIVHM